MPKRRAAPTPARPSQPADSAEAARIRERFERLLAAGVVVFAEHALGALLQRVVDAARHVVGARHAALGVLAPDGASLAEFVTSGLAPEVVRRIGALPRGHGLLGVVIREARPIRAADIAQHPQRSGFPPHHPQMHSFLGVPVVIRERVFGNLYLTDKIGAAEFSTEDEAIAVMFATEAAVAVENARLHEEAARLLRQVREMQHERDLFFAMMNHELRNALTAVYGWAERLVRGKDPGAVAPAAREVHEASERTITLLNNFLDLMRLDSGRVRPVWRVLDVAVTIERALAAVAPVAGKKNVRLERSIPPTLPAVRTDPLRVEQILINLLSNAVRHSPEGAPVLVAVQADGPDLRFRVVDRGPGIPAELHDRIFEPFERFDPHSGVGTGLGLPVSRRLADVLGGRLTLERGGGPGAVFALALPIES